MTYMPVTVSVALQWIHNYFLAADTISRWAEELSSGQFALSQRWDKSETSIEAYHPMNSNELVHFVSRKIKDFSSLVGVCCALCLDGTLAARQSAFDLDTEQKASLL